MHFWQESSCRLHLRTTAAEHRAAEAGAGARLLLLLSRAPLAALPPLPLPLPPLLSERLRLWLGAEPWLPSSAGRPLGRAEEELAPFRVSVAPASPFSPPAAGVPRPLVPVVAALVLLLALVPLCGVLLPPALASACRKPQLCPRGQKPSFEKTTQGCAALLPPVPPLLPAGPKLFAVALLALAWAGGAGGGPAGRNVRGATGRRAVASPRAACAAAAGRGRRRPGFVLSAHPAPRSSFP